MPVDVVEDVGYEVGQGPTESGPVFRASMLAGFLCRSVVEVDVRFLDHVEGSVCNA